MVTAVITLIVYLSYHCALCRWGIRIGYYLNVQDDGFMTFVANYSGDEFIRRQVGMVREALTECKFICRFRIAHNNVGCARVQ